MRIFVFSIALAFIAFLASMTVVVVINGSINLVLLIPSLAVLALLGFGIIGALLNKPKR